MRTCSAGLETDITNGCTTLAHLWTVTRSDGGVLRFTDSVRPITWNGHTYRSDISFTSSSIFTSKSLANAQTVTMTFLMDDSGISEHDLRAKLYAGAVGEVRVINYEDTSHDTMILYQGIFGLVKISDKNVATVDMMPLSASTAGSVIGTEVYSMTCRANLGDARCGFDLNAAKVAFTVATVPSKSRFTATALTAADEYFTQGFVSWLTGDNAGLTSMVKQSVSGTTSITLVSAPFATIQVGDTGYAYPGCDKQVTTCRDKFSRLPFMRAEPFVPGQDIIPALPVGGSGWSI